MGGGDYFEMEKVEDPLERQVIYSNIRQKIFKKAHKLTHLCDAKVSIIMCAGAKEFHEYTSPTTTMEEIVDQYQRTVGIDVRSTHYEKMQEEWKRLIDINIALKRDIMQRKGEEVDDLNMKQLWDLEEDMQESLERVRDRKYRVMSIETEVCKKKLRNLESIQDELVRILQKQYEFPHGIDENGWKDALAFTLVLPNPSVVQPESPMMMSCSTEAVTMEVENPL